MTRGFTPDINPAQPSSQKICTNLSVVIRVISFKLGMTFFFTLYENLFFSLSTIQSAIHGGYHA